MMEAEKIELINLIINEQDPKKLSCGAKKLLLFYVSELSQDSELGSDAICEKHDTELQARIPSQAKVPFTTIMTRLLQGEELELDDETIEKVVNCVEKNLDNFYIRIVGNRVSLNPQVKCTKTNCTEHKCEKCKSDTPSPKKDKIDSTEELNIVDVLRSIFSSIK